MEILFKYQENRNQAQRQNGVRRNLGWLRLSREMVEGTRLQLDDPNFVYQLKSQIESHQLGKAKISDKYFSVIEKYIITLDVAGDLEDAKGRLRTARTGQIRTAFSEIFRTIDFSDQLQNALNVFDGAAFLFHSKFSIRNHLDVAVVFRKRSDKLLDVDVFLFMGRYETHLSRMAGDGVLYLQGFSSLRKDSDELIAIGNSGGIFRMNTRMAYYKVSGTAIFFSPTLGILPGSELFGFHFIASLRRNKEGENYIDMIATQIDLPSDVSNLDYTSRAKEQIVRTKIDLQAKPAMTRKPRQLTDRKDQELLSRLTKKFDYRS